MLRRRLSQMLTLRATPMWPTRRMPPLRAPKRTKPIPPLRFLSQWQSRRLHPPRSPGLAEFAVASWWQRSCYYLAVPSPST